MIKDKFANCLLFTGREARNAAEFYAATFPDSHVGPVLKSPADYPSGQIGDELTVEFTVLGRPFIGINGAQDLQPNESVSFMILTEDQAETDLYWHTMLNGGGQESACGWCKDRWGFAWQITPRMMLAAINNPDRAAAKRAMEAMMTMKKIEIARIEAAVRG